MYAERIEINSNLGLLAFEVNQKAFDSGSLIEQLYLDFDGCELTISLRLEDGSKSIIECTVNDVKIYF